MKYDFKKYGFVRKYSSGDEMLVDLGQGVQTVFLGLSFGAAVTAVSFVASVSTGILAPIGVGSALAGMAVRDAALAFQSQKELKALDFKNREKGSADFDLAKAHHKYHCSKKHGDIIMAVTWGTMAAGALSLAAFLHGLDEKKASRAIEQSTNAQVINRPPPNAPKPVVVNGSGLIIVP